MAKREYPRSEQNPNEYPEVMSKMDPLIIRVEPLVLVVGSTTYTAKVKIGYKFNGFLVHVSGVGIPIYKEEVDITGYNTGKTTTGEGSDAYKYIKDKARDWMDTLEKSMLDDNKEKNIVDLLREIKYQMHFDLSGHKASATVEGSPDYDPRIEVCNDVPTYIEDLYAMLLKISIRLDNLTAVINGGDLKELQGDSVIYNQQTGKFDYTEITQSSVKGLNTRIEELNASIGTSVDDPNNPNNGKSLQTRITDIQNSIGNYSDTENTTTVIGKLIDIKKKLADENKTLGGQIADSVGVLVARMDDMNGRIGTSSDLVGTATLFGQIGTTNTRIGDPANIAANTLFYYLDDIESDTNTIKSAPILNSDADVGMDADHVKWLNYWVQDVYRTQDAHGNNLHPMHDAMYDFFYKTLSGESNICTSKKLDSAMRCEYVGRINNNNDWYTWNTSKYWGINVTTEGGLQ